MKRGHFPTDEAVVKLPKTGNLRPHGQRSLRTRQGGKDCQQPNARPRASSSKDRSPPTGTRPWPWPSPATAYPDRINPYL